MNKCPMCGKGIFTVCDVTYQYDNGETFTAGVCVKCYETAKRSIKKGGN